MSTNIVFRLAETKGFAWSKCSFFVTTKLKYCIFEFFCQNRKTLLSL